MEAFNINLADSYKFYYIHLSLEEQKILFNILLKEYDQLKLDFGDTTSLERLMCSLTEVIYKTENL